MRQLWILLLLAGLTSLAAAFPVSLGAFTEEEEPEKTPMESELPGVDPTLLTELATKLQEVEVGESTNEGVLALLTDVLDKLLNALSTNIIG